MFILTGYNKRYKEKLRDVYKINIRKNCQFLVQIMIYDEVSEYYGELVLKWCLELIM